MAAALAVSVLGLSPQRRGSPRDLITQSNDVPWLELIVTADAAARQFAEPASWSAKSARTQAYARLGALGTHESLDAITRIDASRRQAPVLVDSVRLDERWPHPSPGMSDSQPFPATAIAADGRTFAAIIIDLLGGQSVYLVERIAGAPGRWTRPRLAGSARLAAGWFPPVLTAPAPGELLVTFTLPANPNNPPRTPPAPMTVRTADVWRDRDGDGWTDLEEVRLGINPDSADTDRDGLPDGRDVCPSYAPPGSEANDEDAEILRRAIFGHFGITGSPWALLVDGSSRKLQLSGFSGPVVFDREIPGRGEPGGGVYVKWRIVSKSADHATVFISDWEGGLAGTGNTVTLRRVGGTWYVVAIRMDYIS